MRRIHCDDTGECRTIDCCVSVLGEQRGSDRSSVYCRSSNSKSCVLLLMVISSGMLHRIVWCMFSHISDLLFAWFTLRL
jgi:hypothetical protein